MILLGWYGMRWLQIHTGAAPWKAFHTGKQHFEINLIFNGQPMNALKTGVM